MTTENIFGDFESDYRLAPKAPPGSTPGRVPPGTYKFVLTTHEPEEGQAPIDYEIISSKTGTKGFKVFCEILEPETMMNARTGEHEETKGKVIDHVFWVTKPNLPFLKRDISIILGRDLESLEELTRLPWAGRTFEGVVKDEEYQGIIRSRIAYINPWTPEGSETKGAKLVDAKAETKKIASPTKGATTQKSAAASKASGKGVSF